MAVTIPNMPSGLSAWVSTWQWKAHTPTSVASTKTSIRAAVEELWNVRVVDVRTQNRKGKMRRHKMSKGVQSDWKKAVVTVSPEDKIELFEGV